MSNKLSISIAVVVAAIATTACEKVPSGKTKQSGGVTSEADEQGKRLRTEPQQASGKPLSQATQSDSGQAARGGTELESSLSQAAPAATEQQGEPDRKQEPNGDKDRNTEINSPSPPSLQNTTTGQRGAQDEEASRPSLADLMLLTQLRHAKLWYAYNSDNWKLVGYELGQFETTISRIAKLYPMTESLAQANLIHEKTDPAMSELRSAVQATDGPRFRTAYLQITNACNQCHQAAGVGFIVVQPPTRSDISNQDFKPR